MRGKGRGEMDKAGIDWIKYQKNFVWYDPKRDKRHFRKLFKVKGRFRITLSKIRGVGLIWFGKRYRALWLEWANGGQMLPNGRMRILWIFPRVRYVHT